MGNFSIEFPENGYDKVKDSISKDGAIDLKTNKGTCYVTNESEKNYRNSNIFGNHNKTIEAKPPKPPSTSKMSLGNGPLKTEGKNKNNFVKEEKPKSKGFFRRCRSSSLDVSKSNHNSSDLSKYGIHMSNDNKDRNQNQSEPATPNIKRSFMNGLISPRFSRHLPFTSKRHSGKFDRNPNSTRNKTNSYDAEKLPTHRENSTISTSAKKLIEPSQRLPTSTIGTSCSSMQSLSSIDSQQSGLYSQGSVAYYQRHSKYQREQDLLKNRHHGYTNLPRDPSIFGPRRTLNGRSNYEHFNSNLFLNINQDLSAVRHFIATDRKGTLNSIRKTSAPAELSILDREDYSKSSVSSRSITRTSCPQVTSVFPHPDLCPSCRMPFDKGRKRKLVDTCGHERCYSCMFKNEACPLCFSEKGLTPAKFPKSLPERSGGTEPGSSSNSTIGQQEIDAYRQIERPRTPNLGHLSSPFLPGGCYQRRTLSSRVQSPIMRNSSYIDQARRSQPGEFLSSMKQNKEMSEEKENKQISISSSHKPSVRSPLTMQKQAHNLPYVRDDTSSMQSSHNLKNSLTAKKKSSGSSNGATPHSSSTATDPSSHHSHESGFQSAASLSSLDKNQNMGRGKCLGKYPSTLQPYRTQDSDLHSDNEGSTQYSTSQRSNNGGRLRSSLRYHSNQNSSNGDERSSGTIGGGLSDIYFGNEEKLNPTLRNENRGVDNMEFTQQKFRQPYWTLKPLYFEVPSMDQHLAGPLFIGRAWLYREISDHISSDLPTNKGVIITGVSGAGKTTVILQLVENSCFGRKQGMDSAQKDVQNTQFPSARSACSSPSISMMQSAANSTNDVSGESIYSYVPSTTAPSTSMSGHMFRSSSINNKSCLRNLASKVVAYHFCQADNAPTCLVPEFVHSIAAQLSQAPQLTPYYQMIVSDTYIQQILSLSSCVADPGIALVNGILEPLRTLKCTGKLSPQVHCVIVVDGLCEAEIHRPDHGDTIGTFLSHYLVKFPSWLKIICTVRSSMQDVTRTLPFQTISLDKTDVDERLNKDMTDYVMLRISRSPSIQNHITPMNNSKMEGTSESRLAQFLVAAARGCFLYTKMTLDLIDRGHLKIKSSSFNVLPLTLSEIFMLEFNLKFPSSRAFDKVRDILSTALASLTPLTPVELFNSVNALLTSDDVSIFKHKASMSSLESQNSKYQESNPQPMQWGEFLIRFSALSGLLLRRADETVMFFHPSLRDWLIRRDTRTSSKFLCEPRIGHAAIALRMSRDEAPLSPDQTVELGHHILKSHICKNVNKLPSSSENNEDSKFNNEDLYSPLRSEEESIEAQNFEKELTPGSIASRDLHAIWIALSSNDISLSLATIRNVASPNVKVSRLLLLAGASPDHISDCLGKSPLIGVYSHLGYMDMINALIDFGADVNATNTDGVAALSFAASKGHLEIVRTLLQHGALVNAVDHSDSSALVAAAKNGHLDIVGHLVSNCEWATDSVHDLGLSEAAQQACVAAASSGHDQVLEFLLDMSEVDVNRQDTLTGETALCASCTNGQPICTDILLRRGAKITVKNLQEIPPLHLAVSNGNWQVTELLLKSDDGVKSIDYTDGKGCTALMMAAKEGHSGLIELIINFRPTQSSRQKLLEATDNQGRTSLIWASVSGQMTSAATLMDAGADINHADKSGMTALDHAVTFIDDIDVLEGEGSAEVVRLLLERGANMEHVDLNGLRPLDRAIECGNIPAIQVFLKKGAKLGPTTWSMASSKPDIMLILLNKLLEDGNTLYRKNRFDEAAHRYGYAVRRIPINNSTNNNSIYTSDQVTNEKDAYALDKDTEIENNDRTKSSDEESVSSIAATFSQLKIHLLLNLSRCQRRLGDWSLAQNSASDALNEISLQKLHTKNNKSNSKFLTSLASSELAALQARAKARKENHLLDEAITDLTTALKLDPNNRDIRKMLIKVKEELVLQGSPNQKDSIQNNNNNPMDNNNTSNDDRVNFNFERVPIGSTLSKNIKYVDDSASQMSEVSSVMCHTTKR